MLRKTGHRLVWSPHSVHFLVVSFSEKSLTLSAHVAVHVIKEDSKILYKGIDHMLIDKTYRTENKKSSAMPNTNPMDLRQLKENRP